MLAKAGGGGWEAEAAQAGVVVAPVAATAEAAEAEAALEAAAVVEAELARAEAARLARAVAVARCGAHAAVLHAHGGVEPLERVAEAHLAGTRQRLQPYAHLAGTRQRLQP